MLTVTRETPLFVTRETMRDDDFTLEIGCIVRPFGSAKHGAQRVQVLAGKYEGMIGNVPASFCTHDYMQVTQ